MYLRLQKTSVSLWCTVLLLWVPWSSSEASTKLNGLTSTFPSVTVEGVQPPDSTSRGSHKGSSSFAVNQVFGSPLRRQLLQRSFPSDTDDGGTCELTPSQRRRFYSTSSRTWNVSDSVLEELNNDIQRVVSCAASGDIILLPTARRIQPRRTIIISNNITMTAQSEGPLFRNGSIVETANKARLTCPSSGDLLVIKSGSVLIANMIFEECKGTGNVLSIDTKCHENSAHDTVHLRHLEFRDLTLSKDQRLLESVQPSCTHLVMENVIIWNNTCGASGCMSLSMNNTLRDIQATGNQAMRSNVALESHTAFVLPVYSTSVATNVSASRNRARVFSVANATLTLKDSYFDENAVDQDVGTRISGSTLFSNYSTIKVEDSVFRNNSGLKGGAIYAQHSTMDVRNTSFQENRVSEAGSAIYFHDGLLYLEDVNMTDNLADLYGTVLIGESSAFFTRVLFLNNSARSYGGGLSFHNSNISVHQSNFENNSAGYSGGAIYASSNSRLDVLDSTFQNNSAASNGGGVFAWNCNVSVNRSNFTSNTGDNGGGCYLNDVNATFERVHLLLNRATNGSGGGVFTSHGSSIIISECTFSKNNANRGAGVFSDYSSSFKVLNTSFLENNGTSGTGLFVESGNVSIDSCTFHQNSANQSGSGLVAVTANVSISDTDFLDNEGRWGGGCAFYTRSNVRMIGVRFVQNYGGETGGAIYARNSQVIMRSTLLHNNTADDFRDRSTFATGDLHGCASAIYLRDGVLSLNDVNVTKHKARWYGTVYIFNSSATFHRVLVLGSVARRGGGGVYFEISNITIRYSSFDSNSGSQGGAIYAGGGGELQVFDTLIHNNSAGFRGGGIYAMSIFVALRRSNITNNTAYDGGGCYFHYRFVSMLDHVLLSQNRAYRRSGGGIFLRGRIFPREDIELRYGIMYGESLVFHGNQANDEGGGIYGENMRNIFLSNARFYNNSGLKGAAISIHNMALNLSRSCVFTGNNANTSGGSLYQEQANSSISSCQFDNNVAQNGGSLWIGDLSNSSIVNCTFKNNTASFIGGGMYAVNNSRLNATNISLHSNEAVEDGGGMTIEENSSLFCTRCEFTNNIARRGGGVYAWGSDFLLVVAQIQDSAFVHNRAHTYGGGLHFSRPGNTSTSCSVSNEPCSRVVLLNTKFVRNVAGISGAAVFTTDRKAVLVSCKHNDSKSTFLNEDRLKSLSFVRPNNTCSSWRRNRVRKNPNGDIVGTENGRKEAP